MIARKDGLWDMVLKRALPLREPGKQMATYASGLWKLDACPRRAYWDRLDPIDDDGSAWYMAAELGNVCHELVVDHYKRAGVWRGDEVRGGDIDCNISYRIDLLIDDPYTSEVVPVEIKSVNAKKFGEVTSKEMPLSAHIMQLQAYMHFHKPESYPHGYLHYICRNNGETAVFKVDHDPEFNGRMEEWCRDLEMAISTRTLPDKGNDCSWCEYSKRCKALDKDAAK